MKVDEKSFGDKRMKGKRNGKRVIKRIAKLYSLYLYFYFSTDWIKKSFSTFICKAERLRIASTVVQASRQASFGLFR